MARREQAPEFCAFPIGARQSVACPLPRCERRSARAAALAPRLRASEKSYCRRGEPLRRSDGCHAANVDGGFIMTCRPMRPNSLAMSWARRCNDRVTYHSALSVTCCQVMSPHHVTGRIWHDFRPLRRPTSHNHLRWRQRLSWCLTEATKPTAAVQRSPSFVE